MRFAREPPPYVGGYPPLAFRAECEIFEQTEFTVLVGARVIGIMQTQCAAATEADRFNNPR